MKQKQNQSPAKPRKVDWDLKSDFECAHLGSLGYSTKMIAAETGLSNHQINYRLNKSGVRRTDYRNGNSRYAKIVMKLARDKTAGLLAYDLEHFGKIQIDIQEPANE